MNDTPTDDHEAYSKWLHKRMTKRGRATGQIDSLMESGTGLLLFEVWEGAKDECKHELTAVTEQRDRLAEALTKIQGVGLVAVDAFDELDRIDEIVDEALQSLNQPTEL
jgi:hypothetical protein